MKYGHDGEWSYRPDLRGMAYYAPGEYEDGEVSTPAYILDERAIRLLIPALEERGYLLPRLDERLRSEDLKITHRLIDLLDKVADK